MECISSNVSVKKVDVKMIKEAIIGMCNQFDTTSLSLIVDGEDPKHLQADDATTVQNMCVLTTAIEDAVDRTEVAVVTATHGVSGDRSDVYVVVPWVSEV